MICSYSTPKTACRALHEVITAANATRYLCTNHLNEYLDGVDCTVEEYPKWDLEPRALYLNQVYS